MKQLVRIQADQVKNHRNLDLLVPRLWALTGPNGSGKTALLSSVRIGVLGHEPALGRTLAATRQLLPPDADEMRIRLAFNDGFGISRRIGASMDTKVAPSDGETTERAMQARIDEETGTFLLSFDLAAFLSLTPEKRKEHLFALLPREAAGVTQEMFYDWLGYQTGDEVVRKAVAYLWTNHLLKMSSAVEGLQSAIEAAREQRNRAEQERLGQEKVLKAAENDAASASADAVTFDEAELPRLQTLLSAAEQELGEQNERLMAAERAERRARERLHQRDVLELREAEASKKLRAAGERLEQLRAGAVPDVDLLEAETEQARQAASAHRRHVTAAQSALSAATADLRVATNALKDAQARLSELESLDQCPTCGSVASLVDARVAARAVVDEREIEVAGWYTRHEETEAAAREAAARQNGLDQAETGLRRSLEVARQAASQREHAERDLEAARADQKQLEAQLLMLKQSANGSATPTVDPVRANELAERAAGLRTAIAAQQTQLRETGRAQAERDRAARERAKLDLLEAKSEKLKALHSALQRLRAHVIQQIVGPVEKQADALLQQIDANKRFRFIFERENRNTFDFGFEENGVFRSYDAASTGEDAFLAVVFVAALVAAVGPAWPVLMIDNVEGVDDERRRWLMLALAGVQHSFGNVILAGCCDFADVDAWDVLDLSALARARQLAVIS